MKTIKISLLFILMSFGSQAQNIDNPSFDSVYIGGIDRIFKWITSDGWPVAAHDTVHPLTPLTHFNSGIQYHELLYSAQLEYTGAFDGPYGIKVLSDSGRVDIYGNPFRGFILNGDHFYTDTAGYLDLPKCGTPFPYRPYKMLGHYMLTNNSPSFSNYAQAFILLKKYNTSTFTSDTIGYAFANMQFSQTSTWQPFEMPIVYQSNLIPDTIIVAFFSPALGNNSSLSIDSLGFDYSFPVSIEPATKTSEKEFYLNNNENKIYFFHPETIHNVSIYDINGKLIYSNGLKNNFVDINQMAEGNYLLSIRLIKGKEITYKILK